MPQLISAVEPGSPAHKAGLEAGMWLVSVNTQPVRDVLDYKFFTYEPKLTLKLLKPDGVESDITLRHAPGSDLGLVFESYLMDNQQVCRNKCVFCFIDQLPKGLRKSLYVKDDDARLSFLLGQYITLTNLSPEDIERILTLRISPLHISVQATDPDVRRRMLNHLRAGDCLTLMRRFAEADLTMHAQVVVCPGYNDGDILRRTLDDLQTLRPALDSVSVVPVGLTKHRAGLPDLQPVTPEGAREILRLAANYERVFCSDELYLLAGAALPDAEAYDEFPQLENGVGMLSLFKEQWEEAEVAHAQPQPFSIATGTAAANFLRELLKDVPTEYSIFAVPNMLFGASVTVAGLVCGQDIIAALQGQNLHGRLLIPRSMLRHEGDVFLDDTTPEQLSEALGVPIIPVDVDGLALKQTIYNTN